VTAFASGADAQIERGRVTPEGGGGRFLMRWRRTPPGMTCDELAARITDYLEGALSATDRARFEHHLDGCGDCREHVAQFVRTLNALGALRGDDAAPESLDALLDAFRRLG
jgi:hypothetical protein